MNKIQLSLLIVLGIFSVSIVFGDPFPIVTFQDLKEGREDGPVAMRGFLYEGKEGERVLASQPNLKSCCIDKEPVQIIVEGDMESVNSSRVVFLQGDLKNEEPKKYRLRKAKVVNDEHASHTWMVVGLGVVMVGIAFVFFRMGRIKR